jgi:hypothetical protein
VIILAEADMTVYIRKLNKVTGEFDTYCDGELLTPKELKAYEKEKEDKAKDITMICNNCGKHGYSLAKKNGEPRKKKCPECGEQMERHFSLLVKKDESQIRRVTERFVRDGMDKDQAHAFYNTSIEGSKKRIEGIGGAAHYKAVVPDIDYLVKTGQITKMSDSDQAKATAARKEVVTKHVGNKKNFKSGRSNNSQSSK